MGPVDEDLQLQGGGGPDSGDLLPGELPGQDHPGKAQLPGGADAQVYDPSEEKLVRLGFKDSKTTSTPMVARLAAEEGIFCNVISASTQSLSEEVYGTMMLGIPSAHFDRAVKFIQTIANVQVEEVDHNVQ